MNKTLEHVIHSAIHEEYDHSTDVIFSLFDIKG